MAGCTSKITGHLTGSLDDAALADAVIGRVTSLRALNLALQDEQPTVSLYAVTNDTDFIHATPLLTTSLSSDGTFAFTGLSKAGVDLSGAGSYEIEVHSDKEFLSRPVTGHGNQNISPGSTLISFLLNLDPQSHSVELQLVRRGLADRQELERLLKAIEGAADSGAAYQLVAAAEAASFRGVFGLAPEILREAPPRVLALVMPTEGREKDDLAFGVSAVHWDADYKIAYLWNVDGSAASRSTNFTLTPTYDQVGIRSVTLYVGRSDEQGGLATERTYRSYSVSLAVTAIPEATIPPLHLVGAGGQTPPVPVHARALSFAFDDVAPGESLCSAFSALAVTENNAAPPATADDFPLRCQDIIANSGFVYQLTTPGDGAKTLRVWAVNAAGRTDKTPWQLAVSLDTLPPSDFSVTAPTGLIASRSVTVTWSDPGDADSYDILIGHDATCVTPEVRLTSATAQSRTVQVPADGAFYACVVASDLAGNKTLRSAAFSVDATAPAVTINAPASYASLATQGAFALSGTCTENGQAVAVTVSGTSGTPVSASPACSSGTWATTVGLTGLGEGLVTAQASQADSAGNSGVAPAKTWIKDTSAPTVTLNAPGAYATAATQTAFAASGTCSESGQTVNLTVTGTSGTPVTAASPCTSGNWSANLDVSGLGQGLLTIKADLSDLANNAAVQASATSTKDSLRPSTSPAIGAFLGPNSTAGATTSLTGSATDSGTGLASVVVSVQEGSGLCLNAGKTAFDAACPQWNAATGTTSWSLALADSLLTQGSTYTVTSRATDAAGNQQLPVATASFAWDAALPSVTSITVNGGTSVALTTAVTVSVAATDALAGVTAVRIAEQTASCQAAYADAGWVAYSGGGAPQDYNVVMSFSNGPKRLCAWAKDNAGNVSTITTNAGVGTQGTDSYSFTLDMGTPPRFSLVTVTNNNGASPDFGTKTFAPGDAVSIHWTVVDNEALSTTPVDLYVSTNNVDYNTVVALGGAVGTIASGTTTWNGTYTGFTAPSGFFRIKIVARDASGNSASIYSAPLNTGRWGVFAGNDSLGDGETALSARLTSGDANGITFEFLAAASNGDIYLADDLADSIRKVDAKTGLISVYLKTTTTKAGIPGPTASASLPGYRGVHNMIMDASDHLYIASLAGTVTSVHKVDTKTNTIAYYAGGGSSTTDGQPAASANLHIGTAFALDPANNDLYYTVSCDPAHEIGNGTVGEGAAIKIMKMSQNPDGSAGTITRVAGNCTNGWPADGADILTSSLEDSAWPQIQTMAFVPATHALYFAVYGINKVYKLINGKIYGVAIAAASAEALAYAAGANKLYIVDLNGAILSLTPTSADAAETASYEIAAASAGPSTTCNQDGLLLAQACVSSATLTQGAGGTLLFTDGNLAGPIRIRTIDTTNHIQTVAGVLPLSGDGNDASTTRFATLTSLRFKANSASNQTLFPGGIYFGDGGAIAMGRIDPAGGAMTIVGGNQISHAVTSGQPFTPTTFLGTGYAGMSVGIFNFGPNGLPAFYTSTQYFYYVDSSNLIQDLMVGNTGFYAMTDGANASLARVNAYGSRAGMVFDAAGHLYSGVVPSTTGFTDYARIFMIDTSKKFYKVIGGTTRTTAPDNAAAGSAYASTINCSNGLGSCYLGDYDNTNDRLLFAEGTTIRYVTKPYDAAQSTLGTLQNTDATPVNLTRSVYAFVYAPDKNRLYYLSPSTNLLYCYDLTKTNPSDCNNTAVGPPTPLPTLLTGSLVRDGGDNLYMINVLQNQIVKYAMP